MGALVAVRGLNELLLYYSSDIWISAASWDSSNLWVHDSSVEHYVHVLEKH